MRHLNTGRKFDRNTSSRTAMFGNMVANLFAHGQIETTIPKAKEVRRIAERVITRARRLGPDVASAEVSPQFAARRLALKRDLARDLPRFSERLRDGVAERIDVIEVLFREIAPRYLQRPGGYTQIFRLGNRRGDNAEMALLRLVPDAAGVAPEDDADAPVAVASAARSTSPENT